LFHKLFLKRWAAPSQQAVPVDRPNGLCQDAPMISERRIFWALAAVIFLVAVAFRFTSLGLKPAHHDECVNDAFTKRLVEKGHYHYNHTAYHGPFLYFAGAPAAAWAGHSKAAVRFTPALFGVLSVLLVLLLAPHVGAPGALFAAAVLAVAPAEVYFARTFIHEVYFGFATLGMVWALLEAGRSGRPLAVVAFYVFTAIAFANKETAAFNVMAVGLAMAVGWLATLYGKTDEPLHMGHLFGRPVFYPFLWGVGISVSVWLLLFTSFLTHPQGAVDFFKAYLPWFETGVEKATHVKVWYYFPELLLTYYWPTLPFVAWALVRGVQLRRPRTLVLAVVALGLLGLYSAIPYKTPWCVLSMGGTIVLLAADGFGDLWRLLKPRWARALLLVAVVAGLAVNAGQSVRLNFFEYDFNHNEFDNPRQYEIIYVQTQREYEAMIDDLAVIAEVSGKGRKLPVHVSKGAKNPARLYLADYRRVKVAKADPKKVSQDVVLMRNNEKKKYEPLLGDRYESFGVYPVFPGWHVNMLVRKELWEKLLEKQIVSTSSPSS
jgi:uncharacterized protein (TIGR03663 family)